MPFKLFLSYVYEDKVYAAQVTDWANKGQLGDVQTTGEMADVRQGGDAAIEAHLQPIMRASNGILILVGKDTHNRPWVDRELEFSASIGKTVLVTRSPNTTGGTPQQVKNYQQIPFILKDVKQALEAARQKAK